MGARKVGPGISAEVSEPSRFGADSSDAAAGGDLLNVGIEHPHVL